MIKTSRGHEAWWSKAELADIIVFDLDGTLVDSDIANALSYKAAVEHVLSHQVSEFNFDHDIRITRETLKDIIPGICEDQLKEIVKQKDFIYPSFLSKTILNDQLVDIIKHSKCREIVLATNSHKFRADMLLHYYSLTDKFTRKIYRSTEDPRDKYIRLMSGLLKDKKSIVVFENDENAIKSAIACGIEFDRIINVCRRGDE